MKIFKRINRPGAAAGIIGALVLILIMLLLRYTQGIATLPELASDRLAGFLPVKVFLFMLGTLGGYNNLKILGLLSVLIGVSVAGALGGDLYARFVAHNSSHKASYATLRGLLLVAVLVATAWAASLLLLGPTLVTHYRGLPPEQAQMASALALLLSYAAYGVTLVLAYQIARPRESSAAAGTATTLAMQGDAPRFKRRALLLGAVGVGLALPSLEIMRRLLERASFSYDGTMYLGSDIQPITPNDRFYVVTKNSIDPNVDKAVWRLELRGLVDHPRSYTYEELSALPAVTQETTLSCISNPVGGGLMSNAQWKGVPLRDLIQAAGPQAGVVKVVLHGADGYSDTFAFEKAMEPTTLVVYEMNGAPLPERHGYPVRMIVPGMFGEKNIKWVTGIELVNYDAKGFYEGQGWGPNFVIPTRARFDVPAMGQVFKPASGAAVALKGIGFGGNRGVSKVEVSSDDGKSWQAATLTYPGTRLSWALWSFDWKPAQAGTFNLAVRATDAAGAVQSPDNRDVVPEGATGYHRVTARVEA